MLKRTTLDFLKQLKKNNNKEWFDAHRTQFVEAKENVEILAASIIEGLAKRNPALKDLRPKDCLFRINRDVRFSKDKSPYKANFGMSFSEGGKKSGKAGYYVHIEPGKSFIAGGCWQPAPEMLKRIRQEIDYQAEEFMGILKNKSFVQAFGSLSQEDMLTRPPQGYNESNPMIQFIKLKSFVATTSIPDNELMESSAVAILEKKMQALEGLVGFLNRASHEMME